MSDSDLIDAVASKTSEDSHEIRRRVFMLAGPEESGPDIDPECMLDLIDHPEAGFVDWDALGFGCREPFYETRRKTSRSPRIGHGKQVARAAA